MSINFINPLLRRPPSRVKTPTLLQMEAVECGAAALGIIMGYYRRIVPLPELRRECGVSRDGSKASNVLKAARRYQMEAKGFKKDLESLKEIPVPYIVFWNFNHFLVVEGMTPQWVYLNDPASGKRRVSWREFDEGYTGVVLVIRPGPDFKRAGRKPSVIGSLQKRLQGSYGALTYCLLAGFLLTMVGLVVPVFNQIFVDSILIQGRQNWLRPLLLVMVVTTLLQAVILQVQQRYLRRLRLKLSIGMSSQFLWHILRLPMSFYAQRYSGEIANRLSLNDQVAGALSGQLATSVINAAMVIFYALVMLQYDPVLTAIGIFFALVNVFSLQWVAQKRVDGNLRLSQEQGKLFGTAISGLYSMETLKASGLESDFFGKWSGYYAKMVNAQQALAITNQNLGVLPSLLTSLSSMLILVVGGFRVMGGSLSIGMLVAFQTLMQSFLSPVNELVGFGSLLQDLEGNLNRLDDVLQNPTDSQLPKALPTSAQPATPTTVKLQGYLELRDISFGYSHVDPPLIEGFNLRVNPGQRVALVGGSGSGKSTIAKVVSGLYEAWGGEILFDGIPREQWPRSVITNSMAIVEQEILLFSGSVRDNLTLWDATIPQANLIQACQDAVIHDVILSMPGGYGADLLEGATNLSGGQRQRLEIARALVNNPTILILDEATSALDAETEKIIDQNLRRRGCTCLIVAHRLSTIRDCDEIIVLERGKVVQRGTHQELWEQGGYYARLLQSEKEENEEGSEEGESDSAEGEA